MLSPYHYGLATCKQIIKNMENDIFLNLCVRIVSDFEIEIAMPIVNQYHSDEKQDTQNLEREREAKFY